MGVATKGVVYGNRLFIDMSYDTIFFRCYVFSDGKFVFLYEIASKMRFQRTNFDCNPYAGSDLALMTGRITVYFRK